MEDNAPYLIVREIEDTEYIQLFSNNVPSETKYEEDSNYEISDDDESYSEESDSDTDFDVFESHWFPSLTRTSYIEFLDDSAFDEDTESFDSAHPPFQNLISAVDAIIEELDDSDYDMEDADNLLSGVSSGMKRSSPDRSWPRRRNKAQRPNSDADNVEIEVHYVQL
ncbi:hypothetical protein BC943DRAFT_322325 [Umbelopsis sp. AD052]|nr:hypothetical protein BC943DRAFT_322325 [Umbelopsis sp. AD052]